MAGANIRFDKQADGGYLLDVKGYGCPHVQIYTEKALKKLVSGEELSVVFDNPSSGESISFMCMLDGHSLLERKDEGGTFAWRIRKA